MAVTSRAVKLAGLVPQGAGQVAHFLGSNALNGVMTGYSDAADYAEGRINAGNAIGDTLGNIVGWELGAHAMNRWTNPYKPSAGWTWKTALSPTRLGETGKYLGKGFVRSLLVPGLVGYATGTGGSYLLGKLLTHKREAMPNNNN